jgi:nicotinamidase/pyrazinamidase
MLNDFVKPDGALYVGPTADEIIKPVAEQVKNHVDKNNLVVFLCDAHAPDDKEFERFPKHAVKGTRGAQVIPELATSVRDNVMVITKTRYSGFFKTRLGDILEEMSVERVTLVGVCTHICVMDTCGELANRDYEIVIPRNCVADFDQEMHVMALRRMKALYGAEVV